MFSGESVSVLQENILQEFVQFLTVSGIKLIALDYNDTVSSESTNGKYVADNSVRPIFVTLVSAAVKSSIKVCIATNHGMVDRIQTSVAHAFKLDKDELVVKSPVNTQLSLKERAQKSKVGLIEAAWKDIFDEEVALEQCFLFDDKPSNVRIARKHGCPAFHFNPRLTIAEVVDDFRLKEHERIERFLFTVNLTSTTV